jgi:hypothetical protein
VSSGYLNHLQIVQHEFLGGMFPESRCLHAFLVPMWFQLLFRSLLARMQACSRPYMPISIWTKTFPFFDLGLEILVFHDFDGDKINRDLQVFGLIQGVLRYKLVMSMVQRPCY